MRRPNRPVAPSIRMAMHRHAMFIPMPAWPAALVTTARPVVTAAVAAAVVVSTRDRATELVVVDGSEAREPIDMSVTVAPSVA